MKYIFVLFCLFGGSQGFRQELLFFLLGGTAKKGVKFFFDAREKVRSFSRQIRDKVGRYPVP